MRIPSRIAELSLVQDSVGSVGCGHGQNLYKVLLGATSQEGLNCGKTDAKVSAASSDQTWLCCVSKKLRTPQGCVIVILLCHCPGQGSDSQENALGTVRRDLLPSSPLCLTVGVPEHRAARPLLFCVSWLCLGD